MCPSWTSRGPGRLQQPPKFALPILRSLKGKNSGRIHCDSNAGILRTFKISVRSVCREILSTKVRGSLGVGAGPQGHKRRGNRAHKDANRAFFRMIVTGGTTTRMKNSSTRRAATWVPGDTASTSIWVGRESFLSQGGNIIEDFYGAFAADGHNMEV